MCEMDGAIRYFTDSQVSREWMKSLLTCAICHRQSKYPRVKQGDSNLYCLVCSSANATSPAKAQGLLIDQVFSLLPQKRPAPDGLKIQFILEPDPVTNLRRLQTSYVRTSQEATVEQVISLLKQQGITANELILIDKGLSLAAELKDVLRTSHIETIYYK